MTLRCDHHNSDKPRWRLFRLFWAMASLVVVASCKSPGRPDEAARPAQTPTFQELAQAHNSRVKQLQKVYADGVIEIRWTDQEGRHFEQGDMEMWLSLPWLTALRVEKLGEVLLWLGSDQERYWLFDMTGQEKVLYVGSHDDSLTVAGALSIRPLAMLDLMGLSPLAQGADPPPAVDYDPKDRTWVVPIAGRAGPLRMYFNVQSLLPVRVEALAADGAISMSSTLQQYESVSQKGVLSVASPKMAELIDIALSPSSPEQGSKTAGPTAGLVKIALEEATTYLDADTLARVFDLERLKSGLRPGRIEPPQPRASASP